MLGNIFAKYIFQSLRRVGNGDIKFRVVFGKADKTAKPGVGCAFETVEIRFDKRARDLAGAV